MKLQVKRERWQCAVTAFAMALDIPVANLIEHLGHDGGSIVFPDLAEPANRRGHSIYELIQAALALGYAVTPMPLRAAITPANDPRRQFILGTDADNWSRFTTQLCNSPWRDRMQRAARLSHDRVRSWANLRPRRLRVPLFPRSLRKPQPLHLLPLASGSD